MICASIDRGVWERFRRNSVPRGGGKKPAGRVGRRFDPGSCTRGPVGLSAMRVESVLKASPIPPTPSVIQSTRSSATTTLKVALSSPSMCRRRRFEPLSSGLGPLGRRESAPRLQEHSRRLSGALERVAKGRQRNLGFFSDLVRHVSIPREGSKILSFLFGPRLACNSLPHLRRSWKANS
jgi:hypothetical protein